MSNSLELLNNGQFEDIAALTGANTFQPVKRLPILKVNRQPEDDDGRSAPTGFFMVTQDDVIVYGKPVLFRPFINCFQYQEYDPKTEKYVNKSIFIKNFNEEPFDLKGGLKCGKVSSKDLANCSAEEQLRQRQIRCNRYLFGLLSMKGATAGSAENLQVIELTELPVIWKLAGTNFLAPKEALDLITKQKHQFFHYNLKLNTTKQKKGATVYYDISVEPLLDEHLPFTKDNLEMFKSFQEIIDVENRYVLSKWKEAKKIEVSSDDEYLKQLELPDDEIPF